MKKMFWLSLLLGLNACSVMPTPPQAKPPQNTPLAAEISTIESSVTLSFQVLTEQINQVLPQELYFVTGRGFDCPVLHCTFQVRVLRNGPAVVTHDGQGRLRVSIPLRTQDGRIDASRRVLFSTVSTHANFDASVIATADIALAVQSDWTARADASLAVSVQGAEAHLNFPGGNVGISVRSLVQEGLNQRLAQLATQVSQAVSARLQFRDLVARSWDSLAVTHQLNQAPPVWLTVQPVAVRVQNPQVGPDGVRIAVGFDARINAHLQSAAPERPGATPLPTLSVVPSIQGNYRLELPVQVATEEVNRAIGPLIGREYEFMNKGNNIHAKLVAANVYVNGPDIVVYVEVETKQFLGLIPLNVGAFIIGTPVYDAAVTTISVNPFDYDVDTNNVLVDKAEWALHSTLKKLIQQKLVRNISEDLARTKSFLNTRLETVRIGERLMLNAPVDRLTPQSLYVADGTVNVSTRAEGRMRLVVQ